MEMYERIRELRKNYLKLSQTAFGEKLGVSRSVINNLESNALARPDQKLSLIKLMCKEFSVNEEWLLHGTEPMFVDSDVSTMEEFAKKYGASELECEIVKLYFSLPQQIRTNLLEKLKDIVNYEPNTEDTVTPQQPRLAVVESSTQSERAEWEQEAQEFAKMAYDQFLQEKKRESQASFAQKSETG